MSVGFMPLSPEDGLPEDRSPGRALGAGDSCTDGLLMLQTVSPMTRPKMRPTPDGLCFSENDRLAFVPVLACSFSFFVQASLYSGKPVRKTARSATSHTPS